MWEKIPKPQSCGDIGNSLGGWDELAGKYACCQNLMIWVWSLGPTWKKEGAKSWWLSYDFLVMSTIVQSDTHKAHLIENTQNSTKTMYLVCCFPYKERPWTCIRTYTCPAHWAGGIDFKRSDHVLWGAGQIDGHEPNVSYFMKNLLFPYIQNLREWMEGMYEWLAVRLRKQTILASVCFRGMSKKFSQSNGF